MLFSPSPPRANRWLNKLNDDSLQDDDEEKPSNLKSYASILLKVNFVRYNLSTIKCIHCKYIAQ